MNRNRSDNLAFAVRLVAGAVLLFSIAAWVSVRTEAAIIADGRIEPPFEYVLHIFESRRAADGSGMDALISAGRSRDVYNVALRMPTTLTAAEIVQGGAFAVTVHTSATDTKTGRSHRAVAIHIPANWPMGKRLDAPGGAIAVRRLDAKLGILVVEIAFPNGTVALDAEGNPAVRIEVENRNAGKPGNGGGNPGANAGSMVFPPRAEDADALGLGRLPADPKRAAVSAGLDELDAQLALSDGESDALNALASRTHAGRMALEMDDTATMRSELHDLLDRLDVFVDQRRVAAGDAAGLRAAAESLLKLLGD